MGLAGSSNQRNLEAVALLALFLSFSTFSFINLVTRPVACFPGDIGTNKCPNGAVDHPLGVWHNFPATCPSEDSCELFYNSTYRTIFTPGNVTNTGTLAGYSAFLDVNCVTLSNTISAILQLQYAIYLVGTPGTSPSNATKWQNIGTVTIGNEPSPGIICSTNVPTTSSDVSLNSTTCNGGFAISCGYIFRVLGKNGGGTGDNPRFSFIGVGIEFLGGLHRIITAETTQKTIGPNSGFTYQLYSYPPVTASTTINFLWQASNITTAGCGVPTTTQTDHCWEQGSSSCTFAASTSVCGTNSINYATAFTGTTRTVIQILNAQASVSSPNPILAILSMFGTETVNV